MAERSSSKARRPEAPSTSGSETPRVPDAPGIRLEQIVARIQQMIDPDSTVSHNEWLTDRVGNRRQYDVVIRGQFGGRPILGIIECKDHSRKKGPDAIEAFAKKMDNLGANLRMMVSTKGFTEQALRLAKHEHIGCLSLLPGDDSQVGFSVGQWWYGVIRRLGTLRLTVYWNIDVTPLEYFDAYTVKCEGKPVLNWFTRELVTKYSDVEQDTEHILRLVFKEPCDIEIDGVEYSLLGLSCETSTIYRKKRRWIRWSGDALYDWHTGQVTVAGGTTLMTSAVETDLSMWPDYDGEWPDMTKEPSTGPISAIVSNVETWNGTSDADVPDLSSLSEYVVYETGATVLVRHAQ